MALMEISSEVKTSIPTRDDRVCKPSNNDGKLCMDTCLKDSTETDAMAPVTPLHREFSESERNLSIPSDSPAVVGGLCNEAYVGDPPGDSNSPTMIKASTPKKEEKPRVDDTQPVTGQLEKAPSVSTHESLVGSKQSVEDSTFLPSQEDRGSSPYKKSFSKQDPNLHPSFEGPPGAVVFTPPIVEARKPAYGDSGALPPVMLHEGTPIIDDHGPEKSVEKGSYNGEAPEKVGFESSANESRWQTMKTGLYHLSRPVMKKHNLLPTDPSKGDRLKYSLSCPPHGMVGRIFTYTLFFFLLWGALIYITFDEALPGGNLFSLLILVIVAQLAGLVVSKVRLPPLLGMLVVGIVFRSVSGLNVIGDNIKPEWSSSLRSIALVVILTRAGLGLDPDALRKLSFVVLRLAMMPCLVEASVVAIVANLLLDFPWQWGFLLGFVLAAVSPAVVVPCLLSLNEQGYGVEKGIPTLVIAAASIDDVIAISGFGVCLGMIFSQEGSSPVWQGFKGPLEFVMGIGYGLVVGVLLWVLPNWKERDAILIRFFLLFGAGLLAVFGSKGIEFGGAGALGCLCAAFVAGYGWRKQGKIGPNKTQVNEYFNLLWMFFQPMLFGLIGTEIRVSELDMNTVGWGVMTLAVGLVFRVVVSFFAVMGGGLNLKERFFVALAWLPKATVQAAIGSTALDYARDADGTPEVAAAREVLGMKVLTIAVLVILITAPIGAIAIMSSAPKLLEKAPLKEEDKKEKSVES